MADKTPEKPEAAAPVSDAQEASAEDKATEAPQSESGANQADEAAKADTEGAAETKNDETKEKDAGTTADEPKEGDEKPAEEGGDSETKAAAEESSAPPADGETAIAGASTGTPAGKGRGGRRKSAAGESKGKALNRKSSKAKLTHLDAKPGDHFLVKLKGHPAWPAIICDESMLPSALVNNRPASAPRPDGTWSELYADGGKRSRDRSYPVMYLHTNEFGWTANTLLTELDTEKAKDMIQDKMRKDLKEAYVLAAENNPIDVYKEMLEAYQEEILAEEEAKREAAATPKKSKKGKAKALEDDDDDVDMVDADEDQEKPKSSKKRKAEDGVNTPQRSGSIKKPKIKLNTSTPKAANGTPKAKDESAKTKTKVKKSSDKKSEAPKEAKMTSEERHDRKQKEVLYLRHKLQRGLLTREVPPVETEMKQMSDYIAMLENFNDLEVSIMRATKINKVFKGILKLATIPREEEFQFKDRSRALLDKWNKLITNDSGAATATNGVNGKTDEKSEGKKSEANGVQNEDSEAKNDETEEKEDAQPKSDEAGAEKDGDEDAAKNEDKTSDESAAPPTEAVEAAA